MLLNEPGVGQRLGQVGQPVEGAGRVLPHVLAHLVQIDLAQRGGRGGRLDHLFHAVELAQLGGQVGGLAHAHGAFAVEVVGLLPPGVGHGALEVLRQALHLPAQVHVLEDRVHQAAQLRLLLGAHGVPHRLGGGHALRQLLQQLVEVLRVAGEHVAVLRHELLEAGVELVAALALLEHLVQRVVGVAHALHLLGVHVGQGVGGSLEERVGHLTAELLDELLEALARLGGDEVVVLQAADAAGGVVGLEIERHAALGSHVVGHLGAALVTRAVRLLDQVVDGGPLVLLYLVELGGELRHATVGVALRQHFGTAATELVEHVAQSWHLLAVGVAEAASEEAPQRVVEVTAGQQVVGEPGQQVVGVEVGELLGAVPFRIVVAGAHVRALLPAGLLAPAVEGACPGRVLVQPLREVQPLQEELQGAGHQGG